MIRSVYPAKRLPGPTRSHFEKTVRLVLIYLDAEVENIHELVAGALRRQPVAPFVVDAVDDE